MAAGRPRAALRLLWLCHGIAGVVGVGAGNITSLLDPVPALKDAPFLLQFTPAEDGPPDVVRSKLLLRALGVDLSGAGLNAIESSRGLPRVLGAGGLPGDGPDQLSMLLDEPLVGGVAVEILLRLDTRGAGSFIHAPQALVDIQYARSATPLMYVSSERIAVPFEADVAAVLDADESTGASLVSPEMPAQATTSQAISLVEYRVKLDLANASAGDSLTVLPLAVLHSNFKVAAGAECPLLAEETMPLGVHFPWGHSDCRFLMAPLGSLAPAANASSASSSPGESRGVLSVDDVRSNAAQFTLAENASDASVPQILVIALPAPPLGSVHGWLLLLFSPEDHAYRFVHELGGEEAPLAGLAVQPLPRGMVTDVSTQMVGAQGSVVSVTLTPDVDLLDGRGGVIIVRPSSSAIRITECHEVEATTLRVAAATVLEADDGTFECHVSTTGKYFSVDADLRMRLVVNNAAEEGMASFATGVQYLGGQDLTFHPMLGEYPVITVPTLSGAEMFLTGLSRQLPVVVLLTFRTSVAMSDRYSTDANALENASSFPSWRPPGSCPMGCASWDHLLADANTFPQGSADALWGSNGSATLPVGRTCARPSLERRSRPWCFCRGGLDESWGYCEPEVSRLRLKLLDASKWRLLRAYDGASLEKIPYHLAVDCGVYLQDISVATESPAAASMPAPRRCWGDTMLQNGDAVFIEWSPGFGLEAGRSYGLEVLSMFIDATNTGEMVLSVATVSSTSEGVFLIVEEADLPASSASLQRSTMRGQGSQPTISEFSAELASYEASDPPSGLLTFRLVSGDEEQQWVQAGHVVTIFFHPLAAWDLAATGEGICPPVMMHLGDPTREFLQPTCSMYSIGEDSVLNRQNALRLVLGTGTEITSQAPSYLHVLAPLPLGGVLNARMRIAVDRQDQMGQAAWYAESNTMLTWRPRVLLAGFSGQPVAALHTGDGTADLQLEFSPGATTHGLNGARVRISPASGYTVHSASPATGEGGVASFLFAGPSAASSPGPGGCSAGGGAAAGAAFDVTLYTDVVFFAGALYGVNLVAIACEPSRGLRTPWHITLMWGSEAAGEAFFTEQAMVQDDHLVPGVLALAKLSALMTQSALHENSLTTLTIFFQPTQTSGIFFRYLVVTAPRGFDFATVRGPSRAAAGRDGEIISCKVLARLNLPPHVQCRPGTRDDMSTTDDVATVILPPLSQLPQQPCGYSVDAILPPFSTAWVEEASGRNTFAFETRSEEGFAVDRIDEIPRSDRLVDAGDGTTELMLPHPLPVYPASCSGSVRLEDLLPLRKSRMQLELRPGRDASPPIYAYVHAPVGYEWSFDESDWSARLDPGDGTAPLSLGTQEVGPAVLPDGTCLAGRAHILCITMQQPIAAADLYMLEAAVLTPEENPDVPQSSGMLPAMPTWHVELSTGPMGQDAVMPPESRWLGCEATFEEPNRIRRIYAADATPSNMVVGTVNDVAIALTTVTEVPMLGALVIVAPEGAFEFPLNCEVMDTPASAATNVGLPFPLSAGATCQSTPGARHMAVVTFARGELPPNSYLFTIREILNLRTISEDDAESFWSAYSFVDGSYADMPAGITTFSVLEPMSDALLDLEYLDPESAGFTQRRDALNQVVVTFRQAVATQAGETLVVHLPEGFRVPWRDSDSCLVPDAKIGVPPLNIDSPFGDVEIDSMRFALLPSAIQVSCAASTDGGIAYFTLSMGLVDISRYYALRVVVQNAERNPSSNYWRLTLGQQASRLMPGFTLQAFTTLELHVTVSNAAPAEGSAPPNLVQIVFQPSVSLPPGGALSLHPPSNFERVTAVPRASRGVLVRALARCVGEAVFMGADYSYEQCEATCRIRSTCTYFSIGFGARDGECIQEGSGAVGAPPPCEEFEDSSTFSVYRVELTGNCFRFRLLEEAERRYDLECNVEQNVSAAGGGEAFVFRLPASAETPLSSSKVYTLEVVVRNPAQASQQNTWSMTSFARADLFEDSLLDDGILDGVQLTPSFDLFSYSAEPPELSHETGAEIELVLRLASSSDWQSGADTLLVVLPSWLDFHSDVCSTLRTLLPNGTAQHSASQCQVIEESHALQFVLNGPSESLAAGSRLDVAFAAINPSDAAVQLRPEGELSLVFLNHLRPIVSVLTGKVLLVPVAAAAAEAHSVQRTLAELSARQFYPPLMVASTRPVSLEVRFTLVSAGVDQVWLGTSESNPFDFYGARCTVSLDSASDPSASSTTSPAADSLTADELFAEFSCVGTGPVEFTIEAQTYTHLSGLRLDSGVPLAAHQRFLLTVQGIGSAPHPGFSQVSLSSSIAEQSADYREYAKAVVLDALIDAVDLQFAGQLALKPVGSGSFSSLTADAEFGVGTYIAAVQFVTIAFVPEVAIGVGHRLVVYPTSMLDIFEGTDKLGLSAASTPHSTSLVSLEALPNDDIFLWASSLNLDYPTYKQRMDIVIEGDGTGIPAAEVSSLRVQVRVTQTGLDGQWLFLSSRSAAWSAVGSVSNTNHEEWRGGPLPILPAFDPLAAGLRVSGRASASLVKVSVMLAPSAPVAAGRMLRIAAPPLFVWGGSCVLSTSPMLLVRPGRCWRHGNAPETVIVELNAPLRSGVVHVLEMEIVTPTMLYRPNMWELAVLDLPASGPNGEDPSQLHSDVFPEQVLRLLGFVLSDVDAWLEPAQAEGVDPARGQFFLLSMRVSSSVEANVLRYSVPPMHVRLVAPYPLVADCPPPRIISPEANVGEWDDWLSPGSVVEYPNGVAFRSGQGAGDVSEWSRWQVLYIMQRLPGIRRCTRQGWRGDGSFEDSEESAVLLELNSALAPEVWVALPLTVRFEGGGSASLGVNGQQVLATSLTFWALEVVSALDGLLLVKSAIVRTRPEVLLTPLDTGADTASASATPSQGRRLQAGCPAEALCASLQAHSSNGDAAVHPALALQLHTVTGIVVHLELSLPQPLPEVPGAPATAYQEAFAHGHDGSPFPADVVLGSYLEVVVPAPLRWSTPCTAFDASDGGGITWRAVCFEYYAILSVRGYGDGQQPPLELSIAVASVSLFDGENPGAPLRMPLSSTWVLSFFRDGLIGGQRLLDAELGQGFVRISPPLDEELGADGSIATSTAAVGAWMAGGGLLEGLGVDSSDECAGRPVEEFPCPADTYAYGLIAVRLGGRDSWLDNLQLLCREELLFDAGQMTWVRQDSFTGVAGDVLLGSREAEEDADALTDVGMCENGTGSVLVGVRAEVWRGQRIAGLSMACMPRISVEREVSWSKQLGTTWSPPGIEPQQVENCSSDEPIPDDLMWAACEVLPDTRECPLDPSSCCCEAGLLFDAVSRSCKACTGQGGMPLTSWRYCPSGEAVVGFRAAALEAGWSAGRNTGAASTSASICALEIVCRRVEPRFYAGPGVTEGLTSWSGEEVSTAGGGGIGEESLNVSLDELKWYHYAGASIVSLVIARFLYGCCCRRQSLQVFGDEVSHGMAAGRKGWLRLLATPVIILRRRCLSPIYTYFKENIFLPAYHRFVAPVWYRVRETRLYMCTAWVCSRFYRLVQCLFACGCPCVVLGVRWCKRRRARQKQLALQQQQLQAQQQAQGSASSLEPMDRQSTHSAAAAVALDLPQASASGTEGLNFGARGSTKLIVGRTATGGAAQMSASLSTASVKGFLVEQYRRVRSRSAPSEDMEPRPSRPSRLSSVRRLVPRARGFFKRSSRSPKQPPPGEEEGPPKTQDQASSGDEKSGGDASGADTSGADTSGEDKSEDEEEEEEEEMPVEQEHDETSQDASDEDEFPRHVVADE